MRTLGLFVLTFAAQVILFGAINFYGLQCWLGALASQPCEHTLLFEYANIIFYFSILGPPMIALVLTLIFSTNQDRKLVFFIYFVLSLLLFVAVFTHALSIGRSV